METYNKKLCMLLDYGIAFDTSKGKSYDITAAKIYCRGFKVQHNQQSGPEPFSYTAYAEQGNQGPGRRTWNLHSGTRQQ